MRYFTGFFIVKNRAPHERAMTLYNPKKPNENKIILSVNRESN